MTIGPGIAPVYAIVARNTSRACAAGATGTSARWSAMSVEIEDGRRIVAEVRRAAARHKVVWEELVPNAFIVNATAEVAEEQAFEDMAIAKRKLRDHICETYGLTARELFGLATV